MLAIGALLAGCGGETKTVTVPAREDQSDRAPAEETASEAEARQVAEAGVLKLSDFPTGWQKEEDEDDEAKANSCPQAAAAKDSAFARATSPDFSDSGDQEVNSAAFLFATEREAQTIYDGLTSRDMSDCIKKVVRTTIAKNLRQAKLGDIAASRVSTEPLGDESNTARVEFEIEVEFVETSGVADLVCIRTGRAVAVVGLFNTGDPFDDELRATLLSTVVRRIRDGLKDLDRS